VRIGKPTWIFIDTGETASHYNKYRQDDTNLHSIGKTAESHIGETAVLQARRQTGKTAVWRVLIGRSLETTPLNTVPWGFFGGLVATMFERF